MKRTAAMKISSKVNNLFTGAMNSEQITCGTCTECHCCKNRINIAVTAREIVMLEKLSTKKQKAKGKIAHEKYLNDETWDCPFLEDGLCSIYEVRPFGCAVYMVVSPVEDCIGPR